MRANEAPCSGVCNPNHLLDALIDRMDLPDDTALAQKLKVAPPIISMLREGRIAVSAPMMKWMHDASGMSLQQLHELLNDERSDFRFTCK